MIRPASRATVNIGATTVTYLPDGHGWIDPSVYFPKSAGGGWAAHAEYLDERGRLPVSVGSFLIRVADRVLLIDLGLGPVDYTIEDAAEFTAGSLLGELAAEGLSPAEVDTVVFTHLHHDHVGWTFDVAPAPHFPAGGRVSGLTFARARHLVSEAEWRYWANRPNFPGPDAAAVLEPMAGRVEFAADAQEIAPGVRVRATPGHTPGHLSVIVTDPTGGDGQSLVVLGDVVHSQVQIARSDWTCAFDVDPAQNLATREQLFKELETPGTVLAGGHFAGHVFGAVRPAEPLRMWADSRIG